MLEKFDILATSLNVLYNYLDGSTKIIFSNFYLAKFLTKFLTKFLDTLAKLRYIFRHVAKFFYFAKMAKNLAR